MGTSLTEIAQKLKDNNKKVQLIYGFNGIGKTRLSKEFKELIDPKNINTDEEQEEAFGMKIIYYNAFTEDLFYWDNDLEFDADRKLKIHPNSFTDWILQEQGQDQNIIVNFQHYTSKKLTPHFNDTFNEVTFSFERGNNIQESNIKISKGEENNFVWSVFYTLLEQIIAELNIVEIDDRSTTDFNNLKYIFIDDPVSSLDENNLIELAVNVATLIKSCQADIKFIITTHNSLFYNVLYSEINAKAGYILKRHEDGTFDIEEKQGHSNKSFSYHLYLKHTIEEAIKQNNIQKYHFTLLRNLYEKTATFLGYPSWPDLLPEDKKNYLYRITQFTNHSTISYETVAHPTEPEKQTVKFLLKHLIDNYSFWQESIIDEQL